MTGAFLHKRAENDKKLYRKDPAEGRSGGKKKKNQKTDPEKIETDTENIENKSKRISINSTDSGGKKDDLRRKKC